VCAFLRPSGDPRKTVDLFSMSFLCQYRVHWSTPCLGGESAALFEREPREVIYNGPSRGWQMGRN
jgi:hypothetical protein